MLPQSTLGGVANPAEESLEDLERKLSEYVENLEKIERALGVSPDEPELLRLSHDLKELVTLYEDLVAIRRRAGPVKQARDGPSRLTEAAISEDNGGRDPPQHGPTRLSALVSAEGFKSPPLTPFSFGDIQRQSSSSSSSQSMLMETLVGRACYALFEGIPYIAEVVDVSRDPINGTPKVTVEYIGWGNRSTHPIEGIHLFTPPNRALCTIGAHGYAVFKEDGLWYPCVMVDSNDMARNALSSNHTTSGPQDIYYRVKFAGFQNEELVKSDRFRLSAPSTCVASLSKGGADAGDKRRKKGKEIITPGGYRIPESLTINPQDPEKLKLTKKKKISHLKKEQRKQNVEIEAKEKQSSWLRHAAKTAKKMKSVAVQSRTRGSLFRTGDAPDAKVGVTGSGRGVTQFAARVRHVYAEEEDEH